MSGPWARYGEEARDGEQPGARDNDATARNPYLLGGSGALSPGHPLPAARTPMWGDRQQPPNPYLPNPYLHEATGRSPYPSQRAEPDEPTTYGPHPYAANPYVRNGTAAAPRPTVSPVYGRSSYPAGQLPVDGRGAGPHRPAQTRGQRSSLIVAVVVMVAIVIASIAILFNRPPSDRATVPAGGPLTGDSSTARAHAVPAPTGRTATPTRPNGSGSSHSGATARPTSAPAVPPAAKIAAATWVDAINKQRVGPAQALTCAAVRTKITASFVASVNGSVKVASISKDPSTGTATLNFSYQKTTDTSRQQDRLTLITEAGSWKVCK